MDKFNEFMHSRFGLTRYRKSISQRVDAFFQFLPDESYIEDNEALRRLTNLVAQTSKVCFNKCANVQYQHYTREERNCIKSCVDDYFDGFYELSKEVRKRTIHQ